MDLGLTSEVSKVAAESDITECCAFSAGNSSKARSIGYTDNITPPLRAGESGTNQVPTCVYQETFRDTTDCLTAAYGTKWNGNASADNGSLFALSEVEAFQQNQLGELRTGDIAGTLSTNSNASGRNTPMCRQRLNVRRLTPTECELLQGFPVGYTKVPYRGKPAELCTDTARYKALGNSWPVNVVRWIGGRINDMIRPVAQPTG